MIVYYHCFDTELGTIHTAATERGVCRICLPGSAREDFLASLAEAYPRAELAPGGKHNRDLATQVQEYLAGTRRAFSVPTDLNATDFAYSVLTRVAAIPYGATRTYGQIARELGNPKAARAVGTANARNPLPLIIPCHRVIASNGLGGYGGGLDMKRRLLALEKTAHLHS